MAAAPVIDVAGAVMGGAKRYLDELDAYLAEHPGTARVVGRNRKLGPSHLLRRDYEARGAGRRVAANNLSFVHGDDRWVLLRNALHFLSPAEESELGPYLPRRFFVESQVVRAMTRLATTIVVPSNTMAERVVDQCPHVAERVVVLHHPVTSKSGPRRADTAPILLCPVLFAPYKRMGRYLPPVAEAVRQLAASSPWRDLELRITATEAELADAGVQPGGAIRALGPLDTAALSTEIDAARAIVYPTTLESFGYPLAEARIAGRPVLAHAGGLTREIAGPALVDLGASTGSTRAAVESALLGRPAAEPEAFARTRYFDALFALSRSRVGESPCEL